MVLLKNMQKVICNTYNNKIEKYTSDSEKIE